MNFPKISIITVVFNKTKELEMTLESISSQDLDNAELIIIDGGSDNETLKILDNYKSIITKLISEKDQGIYLSLIHI